MAVSITFDLNKVKKANQSELKRCMKVMEAGKPIFLIEQNHGSFKSNQVYSDGKLIDYSITDN